MAAFIRVSVHLDESGCWVPSLLKVFLSVLLLDLQSKTGTQDPLRTHIITADQVSGDQPDANLRLTQVIL